MLMHYFIISLSAIVLFTYSSDIMGWDDIEKYWGEIYVSGPLYYKYLHSQITSLGPSAHFDIKQLSNQ